MKGTFIQPDLILNWNEAQFDKHFLNYKLLGFDHIILQWVEYKDKDTGDRYSYYPSKIQGEIIKKDLLTNLIRYGKMHGIDIYVGLNINDEWWRAIEKTPTLFDVWWRNEADQSLKLIDDIWEQFGNQKDNDFIAGWYIVFEVDNLNFKTIEKQNILSKQYKRIAHHAREKTNLPIMISPFFNRALEKLSGPKQWEKMWINILSQAPIDILALQDGIGCIRQPQLIVDEDRKAAIKGVGKWFEATKEAIKRTGEKTEFWSDLETFNEYICEGKNIFKSASIERIVKQIEAEIPYVQKFTSFSFQAYQDYDINEELFVQYQDYVDKNRK